PPDEIAPALPYALAVIGMDEDKVIGPVGGVGVRRIAADLAQAWRVVIGARAAVPINDADLGRAHHEVEPAPLGDDLRFVILEPRDIRIGADQPDHFAVASAHHRFADDHPLRLAVRSGAQRLDLARARAVALALGNEAHVLGVITLRL